jgi:hypothetical protein
MEPTQRSETSAFNTQTPGKYPEDNLSLQQHGKSLKTSTKENFQQALTVLLPSSYGGHLITRRTLCYKYLFPSVPTKKQFFHQQ